MEAAEPKKRSRLKPFLAIGAGVAVAFGLSVQAASNMLHKRQPDVALQLNSSNAAASEERALDVFQSNISDPSDMALAADRALPTALAALEREPLSPKAMAIVALAFEEGEARDRWLAASQRLNRRDRTLQAIVLQSSLDENDLDAVVAAFDRIMRTYPQGQDQFFPILAQALDSADSASQLVRILQSDAPWRDDFFSYAVDRPETLTNLARLREELRIENSALDKRLIAGLSDRGALNEASAIHRDVSGARSTTSLGWRTEYPPFDWRLIDLPGLRAQPSIGSNTIDVLIRPGENGPVGWKIIDGGPRPVSFKVGSDLDGQSAGRALKLQARCVDTSADRRILGEIEVTERSQALRITESVQQCRFLELSLRGRVDRGRAALRATLKPIEIN